MSQPCKSNVSDFADLYGGMAAGFAAAATRAGERRVCLSIAGATVELRFAGDDCRAALEPALSHLLGGNGRNPDFTISVWESLRSRVAPPRPDWSKTHLSGKGVIVSYSGSEGYASYVWGVGAAQVFSKPAQAAIYWIDDATCIPYWERSFPFRQVLTWFFEKLPLQPIHAASVGLNGKGILMPGTRGSGKSTTSLLLGLSGFDFIGDDYVLLDTAAAPKVWSLYRTAKIDDFSLTLLPSLNGHASRHQPSDEKLVVMWPAAHRGTMAQVADISAVVLPRVTDSPHTTLKKASASDVVLALAPTTINHLDVDPGKVLAMSRELARAVPAYRLNLGSDFARTPDLIRDLLKH